MLRAAFLADPLAVARDAGLDEATAQSLARIDREGLALAADSFARKHDAHAAKRRARGAFGRIRALFGL